MTHRWRAHRSRRIPDGTSYLNAHRTRKVLTGQLGGIEKLESGWMVAVTYYNGFRIIIPMNEMMINLSGDGRENADTLNRQVRIANNMLGCDIDFIIKDLDTKEPECGSLTERMPCFEKASDFLHWRRRGEAAPVSGKDRRSQGDRSSTKSSTPGGVWCGSIRPGA